MFERDLKLTAEKRHQDEAVRHYFRHSGLFDASGQNEARGAQDCTVVATVQQAADTVTDGAVNESCNADQCEGKREGGPQSRPG